MSASATQGGHNYLFPSRDATIAVPHSYCLSEQRIIHYVQCDPKKVFKLCKTVYLHRYFLQTLKSMQLIIKGATTGGLGVRIPPNLDGPPQLF